MLKIRIKIRVKSCKENKAIKIEKSKPKKFSGSRLKIPKKGSQIWYKKRPKGLSYPPGNHESNA